MDGNDESTADEMKLYFFPERNENRYTLHATLQRPFFLIIEIEWSSKREKNETRRETKRNGKWFSCAIIDFYAMIDWI